MAQDDKAQVQTVPDNRTYWTDAINDYNESRNSEEDVDDWELIDEQDNEESEQDNQHLNQVGKSIQSPKKSKPRSPSNGLKKRSLKKARELDMPPTPVGCEWRATDGGWNLFRCWSERDEVLGGRYKKERYVGFLGKEAWQVMKQYDYETFISIIGQRFRRHSGR